MKLHPLHRFHPLSPPSTTLPSLFTLHSSRCWNVEVSVNKAFAAIGNFAGNRYSATTSHELPATSQLPRAIYKVKQVKMLNVG